MSRAKKMFSTKIHDTKNHENFPAYTRDLKERYIQMLLTNTVGNTFYVNKHELLQEADKLHNEMLQEDPVFAAKALKYARQKGYMRLQPIFGLVKLSSVDTELFKKTFDDVIFIPSDLQDFMTILEGSGRGQGGRAIKTTIEKWLNDNLSEYWAIKYNGSGRGFSLSDIIKTVHPRPDTLTKDLMYKYLINKASLEDLEALPQIKAYELLKKTEDVSEQIELIKEGRLPHDVVTGVATMTSDTWDALVSDMPIFATLRNLNTLNRHGVLENNKDIVRQRLTNKDALRKSKILPFRFLTAFLNTDDSWVKDVLRESIELTFESLPDIKGKTAIFLDTSTSMLSDQLLTGSVFGVSLYKKTKGNGLFWTFDSDLGMPDVSLHDSVLTQASRIRSGGMTNTSAPLEKLISTKKFMDNIIVITDGQQNMGRPFYTALNDYKRKINKDVKVFMIDISPFQGAIVPSNDNNVWSIFGWSDQVLQFISYNSQGFGGMVSAIEKDEF